MKIFKNNKWHINPNVYIGSSLIIWGLIIFSLLFKNSATSIFTGAFQFTTKNFGWLYIGAMGIYLFFCLYLMVSRHGDIVLGDDGEKPQYSFLSWMAMLFSAGMGIGLLFYGVAEPVMHLSGATPLYQTLDQAEATAMSVTFFHWGLNAWAVYILIGLALAYSAYRKKRKLSIRYCLTPIFGNRVEGKIGDLIDIVAVVGTLFGVSTSLGLGVIQINSGLNYLFDLPKETWIQVLMIAFITLVATISVVSGVDKGIKRLSEINIMVAILLLLFVFFSGPTVNLLNLFIENIGGYFQFLPRNTFETGARGGNPWMRDWTIFYWGWWISWSPFVGMFIARISRGRTIKEFVAAILFIPTTFTFFWMTVFGESAFKIIRNDGGALKTAINEDVAQSLFLFLENLPMSQLTCFLGVLVIFSFFVTSSDSGSFVIDMITAGGHPNPPTHQKVYWAAMEGIVAAVLLLVGGLKALQTAAINAALPFSLILILIVFSLLKELGQEAKGK